MSTQLALDRMGAMPGKLAPSLQKQDPNCGNSPGLKAKQLQQGAYQWI